MAAATEASSAADVRRAPAGARYVLFVLLLVYVVNYLDRQVLSILMEPIRKDLGLTDSELGLLSGLGFALLYAGAGLPVARLADRFSRKGIIAASLALWSGASALCGLAASFPQLLIARMGVAVGEAGAAPAGHSLIADLFPPERRATALAVFSSGVPIGILLGLVAGGWLNQTFNWKTAFVVVGLPGLVLAGLVALTVREPPRGGESVEVMGWRAALGALARTPAYNSLVAASALHAFSAYGALQWSPAFMIRAHHLTTTQAGLALGLISGVTGLAGTLLGGWLADRLARRTMRWYAWLPAATIALRAPLQIAAYLAPSAPVALALLVIPGLLGNSFTGPVYGVVQTLAPPRARAVAAAWMMFVISLIGFGLGPLAIGVLSDALRPAYGAQGLGYAICLAALGELAAVLVFLRAGARLPARGTA